MAGRPIRLQVTGAGTDLTVEFNETKAITFTDVEEAVAALVDGGAIHGAVKAHLEDGVIVLEVDMPHYLQAAVAAWQSDVLSALRAMTIRIQADDAPSAVVHHIRGQRKVG